MRRPSSAVRNHAANSTLVASGPSFSTGPTSSGASTHQPALRSVPNSRNNTARSSEKRQRTTAPLGRVFFGGCSKSRRPACERWNITRRSLSKWSVTYFAAPIHAHDRGADERLRRRDDGLQPGEPQRVVTLEGRADQPLRHALAERLHLRRFRHASARRRIPRTWMRPASIPVRCPSCAGSACGGTRDRTSCTGRSTP